MFPSTPYGAVQQVGHSVVRRRCQISQQQIADLVQHRLGRQAGADYLVIASDPTVVNDAESIFHRDSPNLAKVCCPSMLVGSYSLRRRL